MNETKIVNCSLPRGFRAAGVHCGIKADSSKLDLALIATQRPASAAAVFTKNLVCGAPVKVSRQRVPSSRIRGVVINSGNANACTGARGDDDARWMAAEVGRFLDCSGDDVLVCSTGVIGRFLPRERIAAGIPLVVQGLADSSESLVAAATAMMTTDTFPKVVTRRVRVGGEQLTVSGVAKGAAMIAPNMATMLSVLMTDAPLPSDQADVILRNAVEKSFNCISVDGHMSTSDTVILMANGACELSHLHSASRNEFSKAVDEVAGELAQAIIRDAEGASHFVILDVRGLDSRADAYRVAKAIAESPLVKTAIAGADPNWGRIISAAGYGGVPLREADMTLRINGILLYQNGAPVEFDPSAASQSIRDQRDVHIELEAGHGCESLRFWTSDLTAEYVRLNADYTT